MPLGSRSQTENTLRLWLESSGGFVHPAISLMHDSSETEQLKGKSVYAENALQDGEVVLAVPLSQCLRIGKKTISQRLDLKGSIGECVEKIMSVKESASLEPFLVMVLATLSLRAQGKESEYWPYFESWPKTHNCLMGWSKAERRQLKGTSLEAEAKVSMKKTYSVLVEPVVKALQSLFPEDGGSLKAFENLAGIVQSRTFHLEQENWVTGSKTSDSDLYLIPGIDMINHSTDESKRNVSLIRRIFRKNEKTNQAMGEAGPTASSRKRPREDATPDTKNTKSRRQGKEGVQLHDEPDTVEGTDCFVMTTSRDVPEGTELLHTYGDLSDAELLNIYGFIDPLGPDKENKFNRVSISRDTFVESCRQSLGSDLNSKDFTKRQDFLSESGLLPDPWCVTGESLLDENILVVTQILMCTDMKNFAKVKQRIQEDNPSSGGVLSSDYSKMLDVDPLTLFKALLKMVEETKKGKVPVQASNKQTTHSSRADLVTTLISGEVRVLDLLKREIVSCLLGSQEEGSSADDSASANDSGDDSQEEDCGNSELDEEDARTDNNAS